MTYLLALVLQLGSLAIAKEVPPSLYQLANLHPLEGTVQTGFKEQLPFKFLPGVPLECKKSLFDGSTLVFAMFNCAVVVGARLQLASDTLDLGPMKLQVTHQYYIPNPYDVPMPGAITKKGWIHYYTYMGTYLDHSSNKSLWRPIVIRAWYFIDTPKNIEVGRVELDGSKYKLHVKQAPRN